MQKMYRLVFDKEYYELHKRVKSLAPLVNETMKEFIMSAIQERIEKIESQKQLKSS